MKTIQKLSFATMAILCLSGCDILYNLYAPIPPAVGLEFTWWNNLINVPVIEGTLTNNTSYTISNTTIAVSTFNAAGECQYSTSLDICTDIPAGGCIPFKEWVSGSDKACNLNATVSNSH